MRAVAVCLGFFLVMLDSTIVTVALPSIGGGTATLQWVVDAYTVVFAALVLAGGSLADRFGARRTYHGGVTVFALGSILCAGAGGLPGSGGAWLIAGRVVQGVGAAVLMPSSLALIRSTYPGPARQARMIGLWGGLGGVAAAAGPLLGGALLTVAGWPALFLLNVPFAGLVLCLGGGLVDPPAVPGARVDVRGLITSTCGLTLLVAGCIAYGTDPVAGGALALGGAAVLGLFVLLQRRHPAPMLRPDLLRHRALRATVITGFALNFGFYGQFFLVTLYLQQQRHLSPLLTGVALAAQAAGAVVGSPSGGWAAHRFGPRATMLTGLLTGAAGFVALAACVTGPLPVVLAALFVVGFGIDTAMTAATSLTLQVAPDGHAGVASGLLNTLRQVGSALGVAVLGAIGGFAAAMLVAAATYLAAAVLVALRTADPAAPGPARLSPAPAGPRDPRARRTGESS